MVKTDGQRTTSCNSTYSLLVICGDLHQLMLTYEPSNCAGFESEAVSIFLCFIVQTNVATCVLRLAACLDTWPTRATVPASTTASRQATSGPPPSSAAISARSGTITRRHACAIRVTQTARSPR